MKCPVALVTKQDEVALVGQPTSVIRQDVMFREPHGRRWTPSATAAGAAVTTGDLLANAARWTPAALLWSERRRVHEADGTIRRDLGDANHVGQPSVCKGLFDQGVAADANPQVQLSPVVHREPGLIDALPQWGHLVSVHKRGGPPLPSAIPL
jgi:hypothetical protein